MTDRLENFDYFRETVARNYEELRSRNLVVADHVNCPTCIGPRRVKIVEVTMRGRVYDQSLYRKALVTGRAARDDGEEEPEFDRALAHLREEGMAPALFLLTCLQCETVFTAVVYAGPDGEGLAVFPSVPGGITKSHTPGSVSYYLDQAARCRAVDARSATLAMYRVALEHLLGDQGFDKGMCGKRLEALEAAVKAGTAPDWAKTFDNEVLEILKDLGNGVLHTNGGDISLQENATPEVIDLVTIAFEELLEAVYEGPARARASKEKLQAAAARMGKPRRV